MAGEDEEGLLLGSPRYKLAEPSALSPRREGEAYKGATSPRPGDDPRRSVHVGDNNLVMRSTADLQSDRICDVPAGTPIEVLEVREGGEGLQMRARVRFLKRGWFFSEGYKEGWVTSVQPDGTHLLIAPNVVKIAPARLPPPTGYLEA